MYRDPFLRPAQHTHLFFECCVSKQKIRRKESKYGGNAWVLWLVPWAHHTREYCRKAWALWPDTRENSMEYLGFYSLYYQTMVPKAFATLLQLMDRLAQMELVRYSLQRGDGCWIRSIGIYGGRGNVTLYILFLWRIYSYRIPDTQ